MIEQVMRVTGDDLLVFDFLDAPPGSQAAYAALGKLLAEAAVPLHQGCPLLAWLQNEPVDPHWREATPATAESLWAALQFLEALYGDSGQHPGLTGPLTEHGSGSERSGDAVLLACDAALSSTTDRTDPYSRLEALRAASMSDLDPFAETDPHEQDA